ncbi:MAG: RNA polymerase sigma-70 factor [Flavobacteriales bacterium]|nr:RNA polymerase sigma-70 factor [Flavobacteriales bacterium]
MEERLLVQNVKSGDQKSFEVLFKTYYQPLVGFANKYLQDVALSEETVQDFFCRYWDKRDSIDIQESPKSYMYRSVRNSSLNHLRHRKIKDSHETQAVLIGETHVEVTVHDELISAELDQKIMASIAALPEQCRKSFELSRFEGLKYQEIADKMKISKKAVEANVSRALKTLRTELKEFMTILILIFFN